MSPNPANNNQHHHHHQLHQLRRSNSGDKEQLWSRLREAGTLQELVDLVQSCGFQPVVLPRSDLLRDGVSIQDADFGAILGQLGAFGAILDACESGLADLEASDIQRELAARELGLVSQLGMSKRSVNQLIRGLQVARNLGRSVCLVIDDAAPPDTSVESVKAPLRESRSLLASGCQLPAVIIGTAGGTVTRVDEDLAHHRRDIQLEQAKQHSPAPPAADDVAAEQSLQECGFASMMLVAYETGAASTLSAAGTAGAAAEAAADSRASA